MSPYTPQHRRDDDYGAQARRERRWLVLLWSASVIVAAALWLHGCASADLRAYRAAECTKAGYADGTPEHRGCIDTMRRQQAAAFAGGDDWGGMTKLSHRHHTD